MGVATSLGHPIHEPIAFKRMRHPSSARDDLAGTMNRGACPHRGSRGSTAGTCYDGGMAGNAPTHLALSLVEQELAAELPAHVRAFARSHAEGRTPPPAPLVARLASTLDVAQEALANEGLAERGLALLRLTAPLAIESDPVVAAARGGPPSWPGLVALAGARDAASRARFGCGAIEMLHRLHGSSGPPGDHDVAGPAIAGWNDRDGPLLDTAAIGDAWNAIATRLAVAGSVRVDRASSPSVQPRTFVVEPGREVIVIVPAVVASPATRFAVLHEPATPPPRWSRRSGCRASSTKAPRRSSLASPRRRAGCRRAGCARSVRPHARVASRSRRRSTTSSACCPRCRKCPARVTRRRGRSGTIPAHRPQYVGAEAVAERLRRDLGPNPPRGQWARALGTLSTNAT